MGGSSAGLGANATVVQNTPAGLADGGVHLRLMATSDLHMAILPFDYIADAPSTRPSLVGLADLVAALRADSARRGGTSLLFDCGDFLQGGPMGDLYGLDRGLHPEEVHPMIAAMNAMGYDAVALGNHEFNYGLGFLEQALAGARFPVLCANLLRGLGPEPTADTPLVTPRVVVNVTMNGAASGPLRLGLLGLAPPAVPVWEAAQINGHLSSRPMIEAAEAHVNALHDEGADLVVALVHGGINGEHAPPSFENQALKLARLPGMDVLMLGHTHEVFPAPRFRSQPGVDSEAGRIHGRPAVQPGLRGSHLGVVDLLLERRDGAWHGREVTVRAVPAPQPASVAVGPGFAEQPGTPDAGGTGGLADAVRAAAAGAHAETRAHISQPVGRSALFLHSFFARIADSAALRVVARAQHAWGQREVAGTPMAELPILSVVAPFRAGGPAGPDHYTRVRPGRLLMRHLHDLYEYPNTLRILRIDGARLVEWLERIASLYAHLPAGAHTAQMIDGPSPSYYFDRMAGVSYVIDLSRPARYAQDGSLADAAARRVVDLSRGGEPIDPDAPLLIVTNNYRAAGGGGFPGTGAEAEAVAASTHPNRSALLAHVRALTEITHRPQGEGWRLTAPPGTSALFDTSPAAAGHLDEIAHYAPEPQGLTETGFLRLRLHF